MKIAVTFLNHTLDFRAGGAERVLYDVLRLIDRDRFEPSLVACRDETGVSPEFESLGLPIQLIAPLPMYTSRSIWNIARTGCVLALEGLQLFLVLRSRRDSILYVNSVFALHFAVLPALLAGVPIVYHEHGLARDRVDSVWARFFAPLVRRATHTISITDAVREQVIEQGVPANDVTTVHNGIAMDTGLPQRPSAEREGFRLVQVANFLPWKGHECVLRAIPRLRRSVAGFRAVFYGQTKDPAFDAHLHALVAELGIEDSVEFMGFHPDVTERLHEYDALVCASRAEPFGLVLLEGMRADIPVIGSNAGGVPEIVTHESDGLLFEPDDSDGLAECVERLASDPALAARLREEAQRTLRERFSLEAQVRGIEGVIERVQAER